MANPTIEEIYAIAPIAQSLGVTKTQVDTRIASIPQVPDPPPLPEVTLSKYAAIFDILKTHWDFESAISICGGIIKIATNPSVQLTIQQTQEIVEELVAIYQLYK